MLCGYIPVADNKLTILIQNKSIYLVLIESRFEVILYYHLVLEIVILSYCWFKT